MTTATLPFSSGAPSRRSPGRPCAALTLALMVVTSHAYGEGGTVAAPIRLPNGIDVALLPIAESPGVSMVLVSPMGICADVPGRAQWNHLTERLLASIVGPAEFDELHLETGPTAMVLKFSKDGDAWAEGVDVLEKWLSPPSFPADAVRREKAALEEAIDVVVEQRGTFRYALSVWGQSLRQPVERVSIKSEVASADADALLRHHRSRFTAGRRPIIAVSGRFPRESLTEALASRIGAIALVGSPDTPPSGPAPDPKEKTREVAWDLPTHHILFHWPIPALDDAGRAMLAAIESGTDHLMQQRLLDERVKLTRVTVPAGLSVDGRSYLLVEMTLRDVKEATRSKARAEVQRVIDGFLVEEAQSRALGRLRVLGVHDQFGDFDALIAEAKRRGFPRRMLEANVAVFRALSLFVGGRGFDKQIESIRGPDDPSQVEPWRKTLAAENRRELVIVPMKRGSAGAPEPAQRDRKPEAATPPTPSGG